MMPAFTALRRAGTMTQHFVKQPPIGQRATLIVLVTKGKTKEEPSHMVQIAKLIDMLPPRQSKQIEKGMIL